jgi:hypothetical protein
MKIVVIIAMRQEDDSAKMQAVEFDSIEGAGGFISDVFKKFPEGVACAVEVDGQPVEWHREGEKLFIGPPIENDDADENGHGEDLVFQCEECDTMFRSPIFGIDQSRARTIFPKGNGLPEIDVRNSSTFANFCSAECREAGRSKVYAHINVSITNPGIGPVEKCSRCGGDIDMTKWHGDISESVSDFDSGAVSDVEYVAVLCPNCEEP